MFTFNLVHDQENRTTETSNIGPTLHVQKLTDSAKIPMRQTEQAAGYDLYSAEATTIGPNSQKLVKTDIAIAIPEGTYAHIASQSGLAAKYSIDVGAGVIDADYRGEIKILLINNSPEPFRIKKHDCIAQMILEKNMTPRFSIIEKLPDTERDSQGFGSTGISAKFELQTSTPFQVYTTRTAQENNLTQIFKYLLTDKFPTLPNPTPQAK